MPTIRKYFKCGYCNQKQAGLQESEIYAEPGKFNHWIECRSCHCSAYYNDLEGPEWPGGEKAAADLVNSHHAQMERAAQASRDRAKALDDAWEDLFTVARETVESRPTNLASVDLNIFAVVRREKLSALINALNKIVDLENG